MHIGNCKKKAGSLVVEAAIAFMILGIASAFAIKAYIESCRAIKERILNEDIKRNVENLKGEIKYNLNKNELDELFKNDEITFKYNQDFGKKLLCKKINELEKGNDIVIDIINRSEDKIEFKVNVNIEQEGIKVKFVDEFNKSWWMLDEEV